MKRPSLRILGVFALLMIAVTAYAQTAQISGRVTDPHKTMVAGASVRVVNQATDVASDSRTNQEGFYAVPYLKPGNYKVTVEAPGFSTAVSEPLMLNVGQGLVFNVQLIIGSEKQEVTVTGDLQAVNVSNPTVSTIVDQQFVEDLPLNGRTFQSLLSLAPGVTLMPGGIQFSVNGQRTDSNSFTIDGVSANVGASSLMGGSSTGASASNGGYAASGGNFSALGTTQSMLSIDAMQEFQAITSSATAEYGRQSGGQFSIVSRSGTNAWHGSAYDYLRNAAMDSNNWFNNYYKIARQNSHQNDFGGTFSGPVIIPGLYNGKDKTFFFFNYESIKLEQPQPAQTIYIPDMSMRTFGPKNLMPFILDMPVPNCKKVTAATTIADTTYGCTDADPTITIAQDMALGHNGVATEVVAYPTWSNLNTANLRIDHTVNNRVKLFARYMRAPSSAEGYCSNCTTPPTEWITPVNRTNMALLGVTTSIAHSITNDLRVAGWQVNWQQRYQGTTYDGAVPTDYASVIPGYVPGNTSVSVYTSWSPGSWGNYNYPSSNAQRQVNIVDSTIWTVHKHILKFGVDWRHSSTWQSQTQLGMYGGFDTEAHFMSSTLGTFYARRNNYSYVKPQFTNTSLYVQDEWKVTPRLSLSLGLRWDINPAMHMANYYPWTIDQIGNLATMTLAPRGTPLWHTQWTALAPRLGAAYILHEGANSTVLRAGGGLYNDNPNMMTATTNIGLTNMLYYTGKQFPLTLQEVNFCVSPNTTDCIPNVVNPYPASSSKQITSTLTTFDPHLKDPLSLQWNVSVEQSYGAKQSLTVSYVGAVNQRNIIPFVTTPNKYYGNTNFGASTGIQIYKNGGRAMYNGLQTTYKRRLSQGLSVLVNYTWSHAVDNASVNQIYAGQGEYQTKLPYANSDLDVRSHFEGAGTYMIPGKHSNAVLSNLLDNWAFDARISARSALPLNVYLGVYPAPVDSVGNTYSLFPNRVAGVPLFLKGGQCGSGCPGGKQLNYNAFSEAMNAAGTAAVNGNSGRNSIRGFGLIQPDIAVHKQFALDNGMRLQFRFEAFNFINHPNFNNECSAQNQSACIWRPASTASTIATWGLATETANTIVPAMGSPIYQQGGPRSMQVAVKLMF
ncbi:MAG: TonB-dependent receptor [Acidobacteriota bacterium]|nr:TonB-dependent receptor [Acidobacteriota bacterium]